MIRVAAVGLLLAGIALPQEDTRPASRPETYLDRVYAEARKVWLARHQAPDGRWSSDGFADRCDPKLVPCAHRGASGLDIGVTALALFAFQSAGFDSQRPGPYRDGIKAGLEYLVSTQDPQGRFGPIGAPHFHWSHACATLAMSDAWGSTKTARWGDSARSALAAIARADAPTWPWTDTSRPPTDEAVSATAWALLALGDGEDSELFRSRNTVRTAVAFLDRIADRAAEIPASQASRPATRAASAPLRPSTVDCAAAAALYARAKFRLVSDSVRDARTMQRILAMPSAWKDTPDPIDGQEWYFTALAAWLDEPAWPRWSEDVRALVLKRQVEAGCAKGSWEPEDAWGKSAGRVYSTTVMALVLTRSYQHRVWFR